MTAIMRAYNSTSCQRRFVIASVKANGTRWNVYLSDSKKTETFVAKEGARAYLERTVASRVPVQALFFKAGSGGEELEEVWFYEPDQRRKLSVSIIGDANA